MNAGIIIIHPLKNICIFTDPTVQWSGPRVPKLYPGSCAVEFETHNITSQASKT